MYECDIRTLDKDVKRGAENRKKVKIAYALLQKSPTYPARLRNKITFAGTPENPIALDTYENLYKNLDDEFYRILAMYSWHKSGLYKIDIDKIPYSMVLGVKYLIDYNESQNLRLFNG